MKQRATRLEIKQRLYEVEKYILRGASIQDLFQLASKKGWGLTERQIRNYELHVRKKWDKRYEIKSETAYKEALVKRQHLYLEAIQQKDLRLALEIDRDLRKLQGLYETKIKMSGELNITPVQFMVNGEIKTSD